VLQNGDRFFRWMWFGEESVGEYGLGYKLALAVSTFTLGPLLQVWSARMYKAAKEADAPVVFGKMFSRILAAFLLVGLGACLFQEEAVAVLGGGKYAGAAAVVAPVVLAGFFQTAASLMDAGFYVRRRTGLKLWVALAAAAVMLALYALLIPPYGAGGAAFATLGGFAFLAVCTWATTQRIFFVRYEWLRLAAGLGLAVALWLTSRGLPADAWGFAAKAGLWALWPALLWLCGLVSPEEKQHVRAGLRLALAALRRGRAPAPPKPGPRPAGPEPAEALVGGAS
jgi:O-antigen/teichoic acid export membrane protein